MGRTCRRDDRPADGDERDADAERRDERGERRERLRAARGDAEAADAEAGGGFELLHARAATGVDDEGGRRRR